MPNAAEWRERRRLLVAQATLERVRLAYQAHTLRSALPVAGAGSTLAMAAGAMRGMGAVVVARLAAGRGIWRRLLRLWRAWRH